MMVSALTALWAASCYILPAFAQQSDDNLVVDLGYAKYQGVANTTVNVNTWFNIHYAQSPSGALRWQPPTPIDEPSTASTDIIDATTEGPSCIQGFPAFFASLLPEIPPVPPGDEDCLLLNVYKPAQPTCDDLPVLVLIHGGGYTIGSANSFTGLPAPEQNAYPLTNHSEGSAIVVSIQYRLGVFGFLNSDEIIADGTANAGLLDQRLALEWIQKHISAFGGDPTRVTIYGGSAGGGSVLAQMIYEGGEANPPFHAAIAEYPWWEPYHDTPVLQQQYESVLNATGCADVACLRALDIGALAPASQAVYLNAAAAGQVAYGDFWFGPIVDGKIVPSLPSQAFAAGNFSKVPLLTDRAGYEGVVFSNPSATTEDEITADFQVLWPTANQTFFDELYTLYPSSDYNSTFFQRQAIFGDALISCTTTAIAQAAVAADLPAWKLVFDAGTELHGATSNFLFSNASASPNATIANWIQDYFIAFTVAQDPNAQGVGSSADVGKPYWPQYGIQGQLLDVNYTMAGTETDTQFDATPKCNFFRKYADVVRS